MKFVFISNMAAPYQVKLCHALQEYMDAEFWFYTDLEAGRPAWWRIDLGDKCRVLDPVFLTGSHRYVAPLIGRWLARAQPDVVMLGGLSIPSNYHAYRWAVAHGRKAVLFTELSRTPDGTPRRLGLVWRVMRWAYRDLDCVFTSSAQAARQFADFGVGARVLEAQYPADIDAHLNHPLRTAARRILFPNRLIPIYNPIAMVEAFALMRAGGRDVTLLMNSEGELLGECRAAVARLQLEAHVRFLDDIRSWDELPTVYSNADVIALPATFSGGNLSILEGMASGTGVVVSDKVLGTGRLIEHERNGFVCGTDPTSIAAAIGRYVEQPDLLAVHGRKNKELARPYSVGSTARLYTRLLREHVLGPSDHARTPS